jgi:hypothetical protein
VSQYEGHNFYIGALEAMCGHAAWCAASDREIGNDKLALEFAHELADAYVSAAVTGVSSSRAVAAATVTVACASALAENRDLPATIKRDALETAKFRIRRAITLFAWLYGPFSLPVMVLCACVCARACACMCECATCRDVLMAARLGAARRAGDGGDRTH